MECQLDNKPGFKWGEHGNKCYTYEPNNKESKRLAKLKCQRQGVVIMSSEGKIHLPERDDG